MIKMILLAVAACVGMVVGIGAVVVLISFAIARAIGAGLGL